MTQPPIEVSLCMGSSCFTRGNSRCVAMLQDYLRAKGLEHRVVVTGHLCEGACKEGPNVHINGRRCSGSDPAAVLDMIESLLAREE